MRVAIYTRVSTDEQAKDGKESLTGQRDSQLAIAERMGAEVFKVYVAAGYSGALLDENPVLMEMLSDAKAKRFNALLVREMDRLSRDELVLASILKVLTDAGITIFENGKPWDPSDDSQRFMLSVIGAVSAFEKRRIGKRMRRGILHKIKEGVPMNMGRLPYGYIWDTESQQLVIDPQAAEVIRNVYQWYAVERWTLLSITRYLNAMEVPSPCAGQVWRRRYVGGTRADMDGNLSGKWNSSTVRRILTNPVYRGELTWGKKTKRDGVLTIPAPAIIDPALWERVQHVKRDNKANFTRRVDDCVWLLQGMIHCGVCRAEHGGMVWRCHTTKRGKQRYRYYHCRSVIYQSEGTIEPCGLPFLNKDRTERRVWNGLREFFSQPTLPTLPTLIDMEQRWEQRRQQPQTDATQRLQTLNRLCAEKDRERERLLQMAQRGIITLDELDSRLTQWQRERDTLAEQIDSLSDVAAMAQRQAAWERLSVTMCEVMDEATDEERRKVLQLCSATAIVHPDRLSVKGRVKLTLDPEQSLTRDGILSGIRTRGVSESMSQ